MTATPKISVIIPVYNQTQYLRYCLESVLLQNLQEIEVICINDGSMDGSFLNHTHIKRYLEKNGYTERIVSFEELLSESNE